jgi:hypothetical protein
MSVQEGLNAILTVVTIMLALYGIDAWRREHSGRRRMELAEDTLALFYEASDALDQVRNPASFGSEYQDLTRGDSETNAEYDARRRASIVFSRFSTHSDLFNRLHAMRYRFMAQVGKAEAAPFDELRSVVNDVKLAAHMLSRLWSRDQFRDQAAFEVHRKQVDKHEAVFGWTLPEEDPVRPRIDEAIKKIEATCGEVIAGSGSLFGVLNAKVPFWKRVAPTDGTPTAPAAPGNGA